MYKMLAIDMDGTLLRNDKTISKENYNAIQKAKAKGVKIVVSTGRPVQGVKRILKELDLISDDVYVVACSGALVQCVGTKDIISKVNLKVDDVKKLYDFSEKLNITLNAVTHECIFTPKLNFITGLESYITDLPIKVVDFKNLNKDVFIYRVTLINETQKFIDHIKENRSYIPVEYSDLNDKRDEKIFYNIATLPKKLFEKYTILKASSNTLEVLNKNVNKGTGVEEVAEKLGIKREEIISIGDSGNDIHMIEFAGLGVAMDNASNEVKKVADYITLSNEDDGVAHVIDEFILKK